MKLIEVCTVAAICLTLGTVGIGGALGLAVGVPALLGAKPPELPMDQREPIKRGNATHSGDGTPWSAAYPAYKGWPYGQ